MKVFIENPAGTATKNIYNERTLQFRKAVPYARTTPYHYGFLMNTVSGDGDNLDCFVLTPQPMKTATIVNANPIGLVEYTDSGKVDHKILCTLEGESFVVDGAVREAIKEFLTHVFDNKPGYQVEVGRFLGEPEARKLIARSQRGDS